MKSHKDIIIEIEQFRKALKAPLSKVEIDNGWTFQSQTATLKLLDEIEMSLTEKKPLAPLNLAYGLDHWGVVEGSLIERACVLTNGLRQLSNYELKNARAIF